MGFSKRFEKTNSFNACSVLVGAFAQLSVEHKTAEKSEKKRDANGTPMDANGTPMGRQWTPKAERK